MDADWITSPSARRILALWADPRPAWLWRGDGSVLLWRNAAAGADATETGPVPIKGQVSRLIRLGIVGRTSLSNVQVLVNGRPSAITLQVTPLPLASGALGLLMIATEARTEGAASLGDDGSTSGLLPEGARYLVTDATGAVLGGEVADEAFAGAVHALGGAVPAEPVPVALGDVAGTIVAMPAGPRGETIWLFQPSTAGQQDLPEGAGQAEAPPEDTAPAPTAAAGEPAPQVPDLDDAVPVPPAQQRAQSEEEDAPDHSLSELFDRLAQDAELYRSLEDVELPAGPAGAEAADRTEEGLDEDFEPDGAPATTTREEAAPPARPEPQEPAPGPVLFRVIGRRIRPLAETNDEKTTTAPPAEPERPLLDRVSRYNFDELSRILTDRISDRRGTSEPPVAPSEGSPAPSEDETPLGPRAATDPGPEAPEAAPTGDQPAAVESVAPPSVVEREENAVPRGPVPAQAQPEGQLVSLSGEAFILNRLPLGILVFRDQNVLFANRAITEMVGFASVEELRAAGLASIFPTTGGETPTAGPVNHLVQRDGTLVPVTARLQSISWQGRPALMLSASATEVRTGHEAAVRAFAELLAGQRHEGFIEANRSGVIVMATAAAVSLLARDVDALHGKPLSSIVDPGEADALRAFLERPARFAETTRPSVTLGADVPGVELMAFAQGQAGIVTGYFALVRRRADAPAPAALLPHPGEEDAAVLARLSRGIRRPLNSIIGFADLIRTSAFGSIGNERYLRYADDIRTAGEEIAALVEELDDYSRLREGRYATRPSRIDLAALLDSCVLRVRAQAGARRVLVRSAVSEGLPRVRADRASLAQAVLNLLASAIDQTPPGGSVILSARRGDDGVVAINVRDGAARAGDPGERFVVFRDGIGRDGRALAPMPSSVGLALTQSLAEVNDCSLSVETLSEGTLFSLLIPAEHVDEPAAALT